MNPTLSFLPHTNVMQPAMYCRLIQMFGYWNSTAYDSLFSTFWPNWAYICWAKHHEHLPSQTICYFWSVAFSKPYNLNTLLTVIQLIYTYRPMLAVPNTHLHLFWLERAQSSIFRLTDYVIFFVTKPIEKIVKYVSFKRTPDVCLHIWSHVFCKSRLKALKSIKDITYSYFNYV